MEPLTHKVPPQTIRLLHVFTVPQTLALVGPQVEYLKLRGFEIRGVSSPGPELERFARRHGIEVSAVTMHRAISPLADVGALARLLRIIRRHRPHIVHAHTPKAGLLATVAATLARTPLRVYQMRGLLGPTASGMRRALFHGTERLSCRLAHWVICQSPSLRREALANRLCPAQKCSVVANGGNGVDATGRFDPDRHREARSRLRRETGIADEDLVIGYVGRIVPDKGIEDLLAAWPSVKQAVPSARLVLLGPKEDRHPLAPWAADTMATDPRVHFPGLVQEIPGFYAAMDLLVLPSYREGLPNAPLEAAAMCLPVVATRVTGCIDAVVDGVTGTLVPPRNVQALAAAVIAYLEAPELRAAHGRAGRRFVLEKFSERAVWEGLHRLYLRLLSGQPGAPGGVAAP